MNQFLKLGVAAAFFASASVALAGPSEAPVAEKRNVDASVQRVKLDGIIDLKLKQGAVATLVVIGEKGLLIKTTTEQQGDTLTIGMETVKGIKFGNNKKGVRAELTLPMLREVSSESVGTTEVSGFSGDDLALVLDGAGSMKVNCNYKTIHATLGGVGHMSIQGANTEGIDLNLRGAGYVTLKGHSKWLKASLGGLGGLDAQHFHVENVNLDLSGLGNASVSARQSANLSLSGLGSVTVYGKPANRSVSVDGLGKVNWK